MHPKDESGIDLITALPQTIRIYILRGEEEKKMLPRWEEERKKKIHFCAKRRETNVQIIGKILMCEKKDKIVRVCYLFLIDNIRYN